ncbi:MAG: hypothetical protein EXX96DRAFT_645351 [Benjaminiella poitrasii]|nr:MAG: hypothetical protein EXX96DRAFT_645351 [Benjaminiella poitrasii]
MTILPCLPNKKKQQQQQQQQQQQRQSFIGDELHAFDLTWRNYIPSASQFCCCFKSRGIQLDDVDDDPLIEPNYYNDQTLYRGEALENYIPNGGFAESSLFGQNNNFITRNPFGNNHSPTTFSKKKKKKSHKKKNHRHSQHEQMAAVFDLESEPYQSPEESYYDHNDAEFLEDDQIAKIAYNKHRSQTMDSYGEELYDGNIGGPHVQEMHSSSRREFYAAKTMPIIHFMTEEEERVENESICRNLEEQSRIVTVEAAQTLLSDRLDDLTEKLTYIKNNIIQIRPHSTAQEGTSRINNDDDDEYDKTTLRTLKQSSDTESNTVAVSDIDSIASEALDVYENTADNHSTTTTENHQYSLINNAPNRRYSSHGGLDIPSLVDNTPFVSEQHPFTYFTDQEVRQNEETSVDEEGLTIQNVFNAGRKWLGF